MMIFKCYKLFFLANFEICINLIFPARSRKILSWIDSFRYNGWWFLVLTNSFFVVNIEIVIFFHINSREILNWVIFFMLMLRDFGLSESFFCNLWDCELIWLFRVNIKEILWWIDFSKWFARETSIQNFLFLFSVTKLLFFFQYFNQTSFVFSTFWIFLIWKYFSYLF